MSWLKNKKWVGITREERHFCAILYAELRNRPGDLVRFINQYSTHQKRTAMDILDPTKEWELAFEMAYYRDLNHAELAVGNESRGNPHRKFDLALLAANELVIFEAKAQGGFSNADKESYQKDLKNIYESRPSLDVRLVVLCSSRWFDSANRKIKIECVANNVITWRSLAAEIQSLSNESRNSFNRADAIYGK